MRIYYYRDAFGNFGDDLNPWMWPRLLPDRFDDNADQLFIGIGTLLSDQVPSEPEKIVMGAGVGYGPPPRLDATWDVRFVRGPLTAETLGLETDQWITDPAALLYRLAHPKVTTKRAGFIPHHRSEKFMDWKAVCDLAALVYIDPRKRPARVIEQIQQCELILTEAMHGAIIADALRIPWVPVSIYPQFNHMKWRDWLQSLDLREDIVDLQALYDGKEARLSSQLKTGIRWMIRNRSPRVPFVFGRKGTDQQPIEIQEKMAEALRRALEEPSRLSEPLTLERAVHRMEEELFRFGGTLHALA